jgi:hopanoid biosynthesis associated protein HpnK
VERAHREGVLTAASLMVGERAAAEAAAIARRNPSLAVGLHLTLTDGVPVLPPERVPALVRADGGRFRDDMAGVGLALAASAAARAQLRAEVEAQIGAFRATGLACDHLNAHKHFHMHPVIAAVAFRAAREAGIRAVRVPWEPPALVRAAEPAASRTAPRALWPFAALLRRLAARHGLAAPDRVVGLAWTGAFTADRLSALLPRLPAGSTEIYLHPAARDGFAGGAPGYRHAEELAALLDPRVRAACAGMATGGYAAALGA